MKVPEKLKLVKLILFISLLFLGIICSACRSSTSSAQIFYDEGFTYLQAYDYIHPMLISTARLSCMN